MSTDREAHIRLGAPLLERYDSPEEWIEILRAHDYGAAYCPVEVGTPAESSSSYAEAAEQAGVVIAEVGAWSNPLSRDPREARAAVRYCQRSLALAERIGARCCVNICRLES